MYSVKYAMPPKWYIIPSRLRANEKVWGFIVNGPHHVDFAYRHVDAIQNGIAPCPAHYEVLDGELVHESEVEEFEEFEDERI